MKPINLFNKVLFITCFAVLSTNLKVNAQATQATNNFNATRFLGWGTTSGDLPFRTNNVTRMTLKNTTGNFGIGTTTPTSLFSVGASSQFQVNSTGDLIRINNVPYSFPSAQGGANTVLRNNGSGTLTWQSIPAGPAGPIGPAGATGATGATGPPGFLTNGNAAGNTPYWNGTSWITNSSNIFNNGGNVGIGTTTPSAIFSVGSSSQFRVNATGNLIRINNVPYSFPTAQGAANTVLRNNGSGTLTWQSVPAGPPGPAGPTGATGASGSADAWSRIGNAGTVDGTNFIGTTDNMPFNIRVNNEKAGRIDANQFNAFFGYHAGYSNTTGGANTAIGDRALYNNTDGGWNTANGEVSLFSNTTGLYNTANGAAALYYNTTGAQNTANGNQALFNNTGGFNNSANGANALFSNTTGYQNTANGVSAIGLNTSGSSNTASGFAALYSITTGSNNTALGYGADVLLGALTNTTALGYNAKVSTSNSLVLGGTGPYAVNVGIGTTAPSAKLEVNGAVKITDGSQGAGKVLTSDVNGLATWSTATGGSGWSLTGNAGTVEGINFIGTTDNVPLNFRVNNEKAGRIDPLLANTFYGYQSGNYNTGANNTASGVSALSTNTEGSNNTAFGYGADVLSGDLTNATAVGYNAKVSASNSLVLGGTGDDAVNVGIGTTAPLSKLHVKGSADFTQLIIDANSTQSNTNPLIKLRNRSGIDLMWIHSDHPSNTFIGAAAGSFNSVPGGPAHSGPPLGKLNTFIGSNAGYSNTGGYRNTANGESALYSNTTGYLNTANGESALYSNITGFSNTANGVHALYSNSTGNNNTALGYGADVLSDNLINATALGYNAKVSASNSLILGGTGSDAVKVGIGVTAPVAFLDVAGNIKITDGTEGPGKVLTSDADGLATWATPIAGGWSLSGNTGTVDGTNFIGTTDNVPLTFKVNNQKAGKVDNTSGNVFFGYQSGNSTTTGNNNTAIGHISLFTNISGYNNIAVGDEALYFNTTGHDNTANGYQALYSNTTGQFNIASGVSALYFSTTGSFNTATGFEALYFNTTGSANIANGTGTLRSNTIGTGNTANGAWALGWNTTGNGNIATGGNALGLNTTGNDNTAIGSEALFYNNAGSNATAIGMYAMHYSNNQPGAFDNYNVAVGFEALRGSTLAADNTGNGNTAIGYQSLRNNTIGSSNTANGTFALYSNTEGAFNTANGTNALASNTLGSLNTAYGLNALLSNTTGSDNTAIGLGALSSNITGGSNTALGAVAFQSATAFSNSTALGYGTNITASFQARIGNASVTSIGGQVSWTTLSDGRFKKDIEDKIPGLDFITKLRPVTYHLDLNAIASFLKTPDSLRSKKGEDAKSKLLMTGFIAQEVEKAAQEIGYDFSGIDKPKNENDYYGLRYAEFVVPLVKAVQEQQTIINNQAQHTAALQKQIDELKAMLAKLSAQVAALPCNSVTVTNKTTENTLGRVNR